MRYIALSLLLACAPLQAMDSASKEQVISRCKVEMGEYGAAMIKACVDMDVEAYSRLQSLKASHADAVGRCEAEMGEYGFAMIESCAKMDIEAAEALSQY